jgi:hypothetical protein
MLNEAQGQLHSKVLSVHPCPVTKLLNGTLLNLALRIFPEYVTNYINTLRTGEADLRF